MQEAIKQLQERGEKVTAFVVIAVAKQVAAVLLIDVGSESDIILFDFEFSVWNVSLLHCHQHLNSKFQQETFA